MSLEDEIFLSSINDKELRAGYKKRLKEELVKTRRQLRAKRKKFKEDQEEGIADNEKHDQIINMSLYPFVEKTKASERLGYSLRYCDPLREIGVRNFDFLIAKRGKKRITAIFGEGKTTKYRAQSVVNEIEQKKKIMEANLPYIAKTYFDDTQLPIDIEYVLTISPQFVDDIQDVLEQSFEAGGPLAKTKVIIWKADEHNSILDIANPGKTNSHKLKMLHADNDLNEALKNIEVPRTMLAFFPQSHAATQVKCLITLMQSRKATEGKSEFSVADVDEFLQTELYYMPAEQRKGIRNDIIKNAIQIGFIETKEYDKYDVKKEHSGTSLKGKKVDDLWVTFQWKDEQTKRIEETRYQVQKEIKALYDKKPRLEHYLIRSEDSKDDSLKQKIDAPKESTALPKKES